MNCSTPGRPVHHQLPEFTQTHVRRVSDAIQPSHPLSPPFPPAPNPSQHQSLSNKSTLCMRWPKYWSFSFSFIPSKEYPELISFRMDWLDLLAVQGTLKSLLQYYSSKASILQRSAFFTVQLSLYVAFIVFRYVPFILTFWRIFIINVCWILPEVFSASIELNIWF